MIEFAFSNLPLSQKEDLCRDLLVEFGVEVTHVHEDELIHRCRLPWHMEKTPSASLNFEKLTYKCFGCNSSGGLLWYIATMRGGTFSGKDVKEWLETKTGLGGADFDLQAVLDYITAAMTERKRDKATIPSFSPRVLEPWALNHPWLTDPVEQGGRGIPLATVERMQVGYNPDEEKIIIPHFWSGKLTGWQARRLGPHGEKYKSTVDFPRDTIYNHDSKFRGRRIVVESPMSVLRHVHHLPMSATFGASISDTQISHLARYRDGVIFWLDNDKAGWEALAGREEWPKKGRPPQHVPGAIEKLEPYVPVWVVESPWAADPADMDDKTAAALVRDAIPGSVWSPPGGTLRCWACKKIHTGQC